MYRSISFLCHNLFECFMWNLLLDSKYLELIIPRYATQNVFLSISQILRKIPMLEYLFNKVAGLQVNLKV